jgi:chromosome segregation ATPase
MRRALGLHGDTPRQSTTDHSTSATQGLHPQRRRFVRDGDVPVTVIHRDHRQEDSSSTNQLDAARQAIRSQAAAREHAERALAEAQNSMRALQTMLAHERLAKNEVILRADADRQALQSVQAELVVERAHRDRLERSLGESETTIQDLQAKLRELRAELTAENQARRRAAEIVRDTTDVVVPVRRPVGRPRKIAEEQAVEPVAKAKKLKGLAKSPRAARLPAGEPIKWWLTGLESERE